MIPIIILCAIQQIATIHDKTTLLAPVQDTWVDINSGDAPEPVILKKYKDGSFLILVQPGQWAYIMKELKSQNLSILETPVSIAKGDRFAEKGGAFVVVQYTKNKKIIKIDCKKPPAQNLKCWSEWVEDRKDKPDMPLVKTWEVIADGTESKESKGYARKVKSHLENRIDSLERVTLPQFKEHLLESQLLKVRAEQLYINLDCASSEEHEKYKTGKNYDECKKAWNDYYELIRETIKFRTLLEKTEWEIENYKQSIVEINKIEKESGLSLTDQVLGINNDSTKSGGQEKQ